MGILVSIISYSKLLGNYNAQLKELQEKGIISYSKLLGNYNNSTRMSNTLKLYHILNC